MVHETFNIILFTYLMVYIILLVNMFANHTIYNSENILIKFKNLDLILELHILILLKMFYL